MTQDVIKITNVSKIYNKNTVEVKALDDISFSVKKGEFVAIMGPSGSGKSTLMHILGALDIPTSGSYVLEGKEVGKLSDDQLAEVRNKDIGFIFQAFNLLPRTSALKNVMLPMRYNGVPLEERKTRAKKYLKMVGLDDRMGNSSSELSGGQQQRVAIARALTLNPSILLADEPTGNIASAQANEIMDIFKRVNREGNTILMITHEPDIAEHAERIITIKDGKIVSDKNNPKFRI